MRLTRFLPFATLGLTLGVAVAFAATSSDFSDVPANHPDAEGVDYLRSQGAVEGFDDGTYRPDQSITRAEFTKIIVSAIYTSEEIDELLARVRLTQMPDVDSDAWYARFVNFARVQEIAKGYPDGYFRPFQAVNAAEAAKIIAKTFDLPNQSGTNWYESYVRMLASAHAIPTSIDRFDSLLTRGEMAEIVFRLQTGTTNKASLTYEELARKSDPSGGCVRAGCSNQLCVDEDDAGDIVTTCEWRDEYSCYQTATCERQNNGACGWTQTTQLERCLQGERAYPPVVDLCAVMDCEGQGRCENGRCIPDEEGYRCGTYTDNDAGVQYCATCGNGVCEARETCTSSSCVGHGCTNDCGPLYCPEDCDNVE